jgi:hypothetical protein
LEEGFNKAVEIVDAVVASCKTSIWVGDLTAEERYIFLRQFWRHRNIKRLFKEGETSGEAVSVDKEGLPSLAGQYLSQSCRSPELERVLVDTMVAAETRDFGEEIKKWPDQFDKRPRLNKLQKMTEFAEIYDKAKGNVDEMKKAVDKRNMEKAGNKAAFWLGLPVLAIIVGAIGNIYGLVMLGVGMMVVSISWSVLAWLVSLFKKQPAGMTRALDLYRKMAQAYETLEGDRISPKRVRDELAKCAEEGAAWPSEVFAILDGAIARSPGVWK